MTRPARFVALAALAAVLVALPVAGQSGAAPFAIPYLLCDCDLTATVLRATAPLPAYAEPDTASAVLRTLGAGDLIEPADVDDERTTVVRPSVAVVRAPVAVEAIAYGAVAVLPDLDGDADSLRLAPGDRLDVLAAEWDLWFVRHEGRVYGVHAAHLDDPRLGWDGRAPRTHEWLRLSPTTSAPAAWVRVDGAAVVEWVCETANGRASGCPAGAR